jgi:hypothetical protein
MTVSCRRSASAGDRAAVASDAVIGAASASAVGSAVAEPIHERTLPSQAATCCTSTSSSMRDSSRASSRSNSSLSALNETRLLRSRNAFARSIVSRKLMVECPAPISHSGPLGTQGQRGESGVSRPPIPCALTADEHATKAGGRTPP